MELQQIRYFLAAAETLNFTRAAERCAITQPALTRAIQKLEAELGGPLFRRERNHTHLTELGRVMRDRLTVVSDQAAAAKSAARQVLNLDKAVLNFGVMCTIGPARLIPFLARFQERHPGIEISLHETTPDLLTEGLMSGALDVALLGLPTKLHERFDSTPLYRERMVVAFPPRHRFAAMKEVPLSDFDGERYLDRLNCEFRSIWFDLIEARGIDLNVRYRSEREDWIQTMVQAGMGVSLVPEHSLMLEGLQYRVTTDPMLERAVEVVTVAGRRHSPALAAFLAACKTEVWP
jgi:DNA-binding transcriptional LysR family regulator